MKKLRVFILICLIPFYSDMEAQEGSVLQVNLKTGISKMLDN